LKKRIRLVPMMMSGMKDSKLDMVNSFSPGHHVTGMEKARNLWNVIRSFLVIAACGPLSKGPQADNI
jgi:hypothetical protein